MTRTSLEAMVISVISHNVTDTSLVTSVPLWATSLRLSVYFVELPALSLWRKVKRLGKEYLGKALCNTYKEMERITVLEAFIPFHPIITA